MRRRSIHHFSQSNPPAPLVNILFFTYPRLFTPSPYVSVLLLNTRDEFDISTFLFQLSHVYSNRMPQ
jgi:hypothetical protein